MSTKLYNTPEEVAADLPEEIGKTYLKAMEGWVRWRTRPDMFGALKSAVNRSGRESYWKGVYERWCAGEFDKQLENTEVQPGGDIETQAPNFDPFTVKVNPAVADLPDDKKKEIIKEASIIAGNILIGCFISCGLESHIQQMMFVDEGEYVLTLRKMQIRHDLGPLTDIKANEFLHAAEPAPLKPLDQIKDEVAKEMGNKHWYDFVTGVNALTVNEGWVEVHKRHSAQYIEQNKALMAENERLKKELEAKNK